MENLKKILNAQTRVFGNFQFCNIWPEIRDFVKFHIEELIGEVYFDLPQSLLKLLRMRSKKYAKM